MNALTTFYNPHPSGSPRTQKHWANYVNDAMIAKYQVEVVGSFMGQASRRQIQAIDDASRRVSGTMAAGFAAATGELQAVADGITNMERKDHGGI